jgi:hypothetical protein
VTSCFECRGRDAVVSDLFGWSLGGFISKFLSLLSIPQIVTVSPISPLQSHCVLIFYSLSHFLAPLLQHTPFGVK